MINSRIWSLTRLPSDRASVEPGSLVMPDAGKIHQRANFGHVNSAVNLLFLLVAIKLGYNAISNARTRAAVCLRRGWPAQALSESKRGAVLSRSVYLHIAICCRLVHSSESASMRPRLHDNFHGPRQSSARILERHPSRTCRVPSGQSAIDLGRTGPAFALRRVWMRTLRNVASAPFPEMLVQHTF